MIDIKIWKNNLDELEKAIKNKNCSIDIVKFKKIEKQRSEVIQKLDNLKNKKNLLSKEIATLKVNKQNADSLIQEAEAFNIDIIKLDDKIKKLDKDYYVILSQIPNLCQPDVPIAYNEDGNVVIKEFGKIKNISNPKTHDDILKELDLLDIENAVKVSGTRFVILKKEGAILERALANLMLRTHQKKGYIEYSVPLLVKRESMFNSGQLPKFEEDAYAFDNSFLIPTSEVALVNIYSNTVLEKGELPKKMTAYTCCFRKESGSYGKDTKGLIRLHQFSKVELVQIVEPKNSDVALKELLHDAEHILQLLNLPYRIVLKCTGDTGFTAAKTYDIEVWLPSQGKYREISSCSNTTDFQSRRSSIKFKNEKNEYVHMLNGSGLAVGRTLAALVENNQDNLNIQELIKKIDSLSI